jgi:hypothetical protein
MDGKNDHKASLGLNYPKCGYHCFRCSMSGQLPPDYRSRLEGDDELQLLAVPIEEPPKEVERCDGFQPIFVEPGWSAETFAWAREYMMGKRGLHPQACYEAGIGAVAYGRLAGRVVIPIHDYSDAQKPWRGWVAREALGRPTNMPYRYSKGMSRMGLLYNEPALYRTSDVPCFIVEGTIDALALWPDAVAVLGKPLDSQMEKFQLARRPLAVCLDGDAWETGLRLAWDLQHMGKRAGNIRLPPKLDPDEVDRAWLDAEARRVIGG